jgi:hypothetical protein
MAPSNKVVASLRRIATVLAVILCVPALGYLFWSPGLDVRDGRHDRGSNAVWLAHGWLGADEWFLTNGKTNEYDRYRAPKNVRALAQKLRTNHISDVYPHLCPASSDGHLPPLDAKQTELFLDAFAGFRVLPWIGGPNGSSVRAENERWSNTFIIEIQSLLARHPRLAGVHLNVEPMPSGDPDFLKLLDAIKAVLPKGKLLSIAAYPPPTRWHPYPEVHWEKSYFRQVAKRCDQVAVMMYDAGQTLPKTYQKLMADWTSEVLAWSEGKSVLLGVPTYDDAGVGYHNPKVENLTNALLGTHRGLTRASLPLNYQGAAIYCDWETSDAEWRFWREHFCRAESQ